MKLTLKIFIVIMLLAALPVFAQEETLSEEDMATVDRVLAALEAATDYHSYTVNQSDLLGTNITITADGEEILRQEESKLEGYTYTVLNGETPNIAGTANIVGTTIENETETSFIINGELRLVDGTAYVNVSYLAPDDSLPALPEGWTAVTEADLEIYPGLGELSLDKIFKVMEEGGPVPFVINYEAFAEAVRNSAILVTTEPATLSDGREGEIITIMMDGDSLGQLITSNEEAAENPVMMAISENLAEDSTAFLIVSLNEDGTLAQVSLTMSFITTELEGAVLSSQLPEGSTVTVEIVNTSVVDFSGINGTYMPAEAPAE